MSLAAADRAGSGPEDRGNRMELLALLLAAGAAAAAYLVWRQRQQDAARRARPPEDIIAGDPHVIEQLRGIRNGDVIAHEGTQWFVRGRLDFDEHGYRWTEHLLDDASTRRWLSVEDDEAFKLSLWQGIAEGDVEQGAPGDRDVIVGGVAYRLQEQGTAAFTATGATGTAPTGSCRYADYRSVDGRLLGFENFGGRWEASLGEPLETWEITVFPGSDRPAGP